MAAGRSLGAAPRQFFWIFSEFGVLAPTELGSSVLPPPGLDSSVLAPPGLDFLRSLDFNKPLLFKKNPAEICFQMPLAFKCRFAGAQQLKMNKSAMCVAAQIIKTHRDGTKTARSGFGKSLNLS